MRRSNRRLTIQSTIPVSIGAEYDRIDVEIRGEVSPFIPGRFSGPPENCYPDEGGEAMNVSVFLLDEHGIRGRELMEGEYDSDCAAEALILAAEDEEECEQDRVDDAKMEAWKESRFARAG